MEQISGMPDIFDRLIGQLVELPDVSTTKPSTVQTVVPMMGVSQTFIVQTFRQRDKGDTIFLQCVNKEGTIRLAVPPAVADAIARQRESLTGKVRSKASQATALARKERGEVPAFMRKKSDSERSDVVAAILTGGRAKRKIPVKR